ncbi:methyl-accepting chemotaxis protein [Shinella sp. BE166]|uniref:HAMP domain-containing protein n=1 Tax=Shinella sp. BE166 TaxID=3373918 RepID=UPI003EBF820E
MSFLQNAKIITKVLAPLVMLSVITITSTFYLSWNYLKADSAYSEFLATDNKATLLVARANTSIHTIIYIAYKVIVYDANSPQMPGLKQSYSENAKIAIEQLETAKERMPAEAMDIQAFADATRAIIVELDKAVEYASRNKNDEALVILARQDEEIIKLRKSIAAWVETGIASVDAQSETLTTDAHFTVDTSLVVLGVVLLAAIIASLAVTIYGITRPVNALRQRMLTLAEGETAAPVSGLARKDEVGQMAAAVAVFRDNAIERIRLEQEAEANRGLSEQERRQREEQKAQEAATIQHAASSLQVQAGVQKVRETGAALGTIATEVQEINRNVSAIVEAAREQSIGLQEINTAVNSMDQGTQQNAAMVEQTTAATHSLSTDVSTLSQLLAQFKLDERQSGPAMVTAMNPAAAKASPARTLARKVATAFSNSSALAQAPQGDQWEEF